MEIIGLNKEGDHFPPFFSYKNLRAEIFVREKRRKMVTFLDFYLCPYGCIDESQNTNDKIPQKWHKKHELV